MLVNPFEQKGNWYKANLHTHSTTSDGDMAFQTRITQYKEKGYSILALTDHGKTNPITGLSSRDFLLISGMEIHPPCNLNGDCYHFVCLNVPESFKAPESLDPNVCLQEVRKAGGEFIIAHPYWCGHNLTHLLDIKGAIGVEVYNATCSKIGKAYSSVQWDDLLDLGWEIPAVAVDDVHRGRDIFMGWTMIKSRNLDVPSVMEALRTGSYYASCGPEIKDFRIVNKKAIVECSPVSEIYFMAQRWGGGSAFADQGPDLVKAEFDVPDDLKYLRVELVDRKGNRAWTNPIFLKK
jgi:hypothetical protein